MLDDYDRILKIKNVIPFLLDYTWVISIYTLVGFTLGIGIDKYLYGRLSKEIIEESSTGFIFFEIFTHFALLNFLAIFISGLMHKIPSPANFFKFLEVNKPELHFMRNPSVFMIIMFSASETLHNSVNEFIHRFK